MVRILGRLLLYTVQGCKRAPWLFLTSHHPNAPGRNGCEERGHILVPHALPTWKTRSLWSSIVCGKYLQGIPFLCTWLRIGSWSLKYPVEMVLKIFFWVPKAKQIGAGPCERWLHSNFYSRQLLLGNLVTRIEFSVWRSSGCQEGLVKLNGVVVPSWGIQNTNVSNLIFFGRCPL